MAERLAIIGGDAAGMSAASQARRRAPDLDIVAFERGPYTSYSACGIPYFLGHDFEDPERLVVRTPAQHRERGIDARVGHEVVAIDLDARRLTVVVDGAREITEPFDQLVVATGAAAVAPPVPGAELVEPARTVDAAQRLDARLTAGGHAVVVGGGYIGIEMAEAMVKRGLTVTLVEAADQVMAGTLDPDIARHVQDGAENEGIVVRTGTPLEAVEHDADGRPSAVVVANGERIRADQVVVATGVKPAVAIAREAGMLVGASGALMVDDRQRVPGFDGVYAAGDCVESWHRVLRKPVNIQLGTHANRQGRVAGINATGGSAAFPGVLGTAVSRICSREIARTGLSEREAEGAGLDFVTATVEATTRARYFPGSGPIWVKLVVERGTRRLLGGQLVGTEGAAKRVDVLATALWAEMTVDDVESLDLGYAPPIAPVSDPVIQAAASAIRALDG